MKNAIFEKYAEFFSFREILSAENPKGDPLISQNAFPSKNVLKSGRVVTT